MGSNGVLSGSMQTGPGRAYEDGVLGSVLSTGPGHAVSDGVLGGPMQTGQGRAYREGSLGCTSGCSGAMATGPGHAFRDGVLSAFGSTVRITRAGKRARHPSQYGRKPLRGLGGVAFTSDFFLGVAGGAIAVYFVKKGMG